MNELVSIVIVNWNGMEWNENCIRSLLTQSYKNFEIIFVDNDSNDGSCEIIENKFKKFNIKFIKNKSNRGFAGGNNDAIPYLSGDYVLLLNNDTEVPREFLENFIGAFKKNTRIGVAQPKILQIENKKLFDSAGSFFTRTGILYHYGNGKNNVDRIYKKQYPVFSVKGASLLIKKDLLTKIGLFDEDFWCYYEETDFCHRAWVLGYECWYLPEAFIFHKIGGTSSRFNNSKIQFHNFKNKILSATKNYEISTLLWLIPTMLLINTLLSIIWLIQGDFSKALSIYRAYIWNIKNINNTLRKRKKIQENRINTDAMIFKLVGRRPKFIYYYYLFRNQLEKYKDIL